MKNLSGHNYEFGKLLMYVLSKFNEEECIMSGENINIYSFGYNMNKKDLINKEISGMSDDGLSKLLEIILLMKREGVENPDGLMGVSQRVLARDWLDPQEDEVWGNL